jgi:serine/threonine protein kinase
MIEQLGHFRILEPMGGGGLGQMFRARDASLGRTVALKLLPPEITGNPERLEQLLHDARVATALSHPNIAALYEVAQDDGTPFLVLEYVPGLSLRNVIAGRPLNPRRAVDLAIQLADALADAHAADIVHGDLKPDNIIVTPKGAAKILDFGLSAWTRGGQLRRSAARLEPADAAALQGTIAYLAPEQALGERADGRADIFSLGVILYEMLTGRNPFAGATTDALVMEIAGAQPGGVTSTTGGLPAELEPIVSRALAKSLQDRYQTAATLAAELRGVAAMLEERASVAAEQMETVRPVREGPTWTWVVLAAAAAAAAAWLGRGALMRLLDVIPR